MRMRRRRGLLRVGLGPGLDELTTGSGHGKVWTSVLSELERSGEVELTAGNGADVWLANGHAPPPAVVGPLVVLVHEIGWHTPELRAFLYPEFADQMEADTAAAVAAASQVITVSDSTRTELLKTGDVAEGCVHAVHSGVDHELFRPGLTGSSEFVARALGLHGHVPYVLFVGVLHPRKNYGAVREAMAGLAGRGLPHVLVMVGSVALDRPDATEFEREATAPLPGLPGRLARLQDLSDQQLAAVIAGADAFCLPSFYEGFGLPALEAMACGTPVVVSDRGALPEVVGGAGLVVAPTAAAVESALHRVLTDSELARELREAGLARAGGFSWRRTAEGWLRVLRLAAAGER